MTKTPGAVSGLAYAGRAFDHYPSDINICKRKRSLKDTVGELSGYRNHRVWHSSHENIGSVKLFL